MYKRKLFSLSSDRNCLIKLNCTVTLKWLSIKNGYQVSIKGTSWDQFFAFLTKLRDDKRDDTWYSDHDTCFKFSGKLKFTLRTTELLQ